MIFVMEVRQEKCVKALRNRASQGQYLAFLSVKYEVDPDKFFMHQSQQKKTENPNVEAFQLSVAVKHKTKPFF
jgi:hypothetical protein